MNDSEPRVTIVSAGQLSTCPRMVKVADALHAEGYHVRVVMNRRTDWASQSDKLLEAERSWLDAAAIDTRRGSGGGTFWPFWPFWKAAARYHMARRITRTLGVARTSAPLRRWALLRPSEALLEATMSQPTDFLYFGAGSYPIAPEAARRLSVPYAIDFEDFHRGEQDTSAEGRFQSELTASVEADAVRDARFVSMGSPLISARYEECLGVSGVVLHNVFPLPSEAPAFELLRRPLKLYWFSQTIGPGRGIEHAIRGAGAAAIETELRLRGRIDGSYREGLESLARQVAPKLKLTIHAPNSSAGMIDACRPFDIGLSLETGAIPNTRVLLSNKVFTYMLAGLATIYSDTPAQRAFRDALGDRQPICALDDTTALATILKTWDADRTSLLAAQRDAWQWAKRRWHWEHDDERGALLRLFDEHLSKVARCA